MRYIIYLRISTVEQDLRTQEQKVLRYLRQKYGDEITYLLFTDSISTRKPLNEREGVQAALKSLREGDVLVALKIDRLARNEMELHMINHFIKKYKMELIMVDQPELHNAAMFSLYAMFAAMEVKMIRERIRDKLHEKQQRGERTGDVRYGFKLDQNNKILVNGSRKGEKILKAGMLIEQDKEQECLKYMCELFDQGFSYRQIAKMINFRGYKNRKGNEWDHGTVYRLLIRAGRTRFLEKLQISKEDPWTQEQRLQSLVLDDKVSRKSLKKPSGHHQTLSHQCNQGRV